MLMNALLLALREIRRNLMRSFLTVLGIVIGVAAVITMVTLGNGATRMVAEQISSLGSNLLIMRPGQRLGPGRDEAGAPKFRVADAEAIKSQVSTLQAVAPVVGSSVTLVAGNENWSSTVSGTTNAYFITGNWKLAAGRQFSDEDEKVGRAVCVIGNTVRDKLFGHQNPLGAELRIKNFSCEIIGLLASKGQGAMGMDQDDVVVIPLLTAQRRLTGNQDVATLMISMQDGADTSRVMAQIRQLMRERRKLAENDDDNFNLMDTKQIAQALSGTIGTMTALLGAVAAVSLLVGGIGIMNIMLVSVTERTR
ncbi:MAG: ABC transporter permease, partial [Azovibrio sp.]|nr:ABC transporter permease [Azovibrio sp.]